MDRELSRISLTVGTLLSALSGLLLLVLIANWVQSHSNPEIQSQTLSADMPLALRLLR
jgi:hypothetical protein